MRTRHAIVAILAIPLLAAQIGYQGPASEYSMDRPMPTMQMPFVRSGTGDPIIFGGLTTTAKQFEISKPADATAYRFVNPCNVDVRIRKVGSMQESVTPTTGTRFMARSSEVLGTSQPRYVSLITMAAPSADCSVELQYGRGS